MIADKNKKTKTVRKRKQSLKKWIELNYPHILYEYEVLIKHEL